MDEKDSYVCSECGAEFDTPIELARHVRMEHPKEKKEEDKGEEKKYECEYCHKKFDSEAGLLSHIGQVHKKEEEEKKELKKMEKEGTLSLEDEMNIEMEKRLASELRNLPGVSATRRNYILERFKNVDALKQDPTQLHAIIRRNSKADDTDIALTVSSVFNIRNEYMQRMGQRGGVIYQQPQQPYQQSTYLYPPTTATAQGVPLRYPPPTSTNYQPWTPSQQPFSQPYHTTSLSSKRYDEFDVERKARKIAEELAERKMAEYKREEEEKAKVKELEEGIGMLAKELKELKEEGVPSKGGEEKPRGETPQDKVFNAWLEAQIKGEGKKEGETPQDKVFNAWLEAQIKGEGKKEGLTKEEIENLLMKTRGLTKEEVQKMLEEKEKDRTMEQMSAEIRGLRDTLSSLPRSGGGYASDDARLVADSIGVLSKKMDHGHETMKTIIEQVPKILPQMQLQQPSRGYTEEEIKKIEKEISKPIEEEKPKEGLLVQALGKEYIDEK